VSNPYIPQAIRDRVAEYFQYRCAYCQTSQQIIGPLLEIDHIVPIAHGGQSHEDNLALACPMCNGHKSDLTEAIDPQTGLAVPLFNPRHHRWSAHFHWIEDGTVVHGVTATGRATVEALKVSHRDIVTVRQLWVSVGWHPPKS
jgi:hypothetical protein